MGHADAILGQWAFRADIQHPPFYLDGQVLGTGTVESVHQTPASVNRSRFGDTTQLRIRLTDGTEYVSHGPFQFSRDANGEHWSGDNLIVDALDVMDVQTGRLRRAVRRGSISDSAVATALAFGIG